MAADLNIYCPGNLRSYISIFKFSVLCIFYRFTNKDKPPPQTHEQSTTLQEPNGSITAKDTPDDGPVRTRNM
jgi:hypothetical protein